MGPSLVALSVMLSTTYLLATSTDQAARTASGCTTPIDQDTFSNASTWTVVDPVTSGNGSVFVGSGALIFSSIEPNGPWCTTNLGACSGREMRLYRPLITGLPLSNSSWRAEWQFRLDGGNGPNHTLMGFTAGTGEPRGSFTSSPPWICGSPTLAGSNYSETQQDGIFASVIAFGNNQIPSRYNDQIFDPLVQAYDATHPTSASNPPNLGWRIFGHGKNDRGPFYQTAIAASNTTAPPLNYSRGIEVPSLHGEYFVRLERLNPSSCMISVFSDAAMTQHVPGSPQCFYIEPDIVDLWAMQNFTHSGGSFFRSLNGSVDDLRVYDQCPNVPALAATASGGGTICTGSNATLIATPGFSSYTWTGGGLNTTSSSNTVTVTPTATTTYTVHATYPGVHCPLAARVTVNVAATTYVNFDPDFSLVAESPAGNVGYFTARATPVAGSTNANIAAFGSGYGYLWKIEEVGSTTNLLANNPSNWWWNIPNPPYNGFGGFNGVTMNTAASYLSAGQFNLTTKYRITRGVWNPCRYAEKSKLVYLCEGCRSPDGRPVLVVEDDD